jgi:hypothetical protein
MIHTTNNKNHSNKKVHISCILQKPVPETNSRERDIDIDTSYGFETINNSPSNNSLINDSPNNDGSSNDPTNNDSTSNDPTINDSISEFLSKIQNKYSGNAEQKHLNQLYDIGILVVNKNFNRQKIIQKITKIIEKRSNDPIKQIRDAKKEALLASFKKGIDDALSNEYRMAYDNTNKYQYDKEKLKIRARIDRVLHKN